MRQHKLGKANSTADAPAKLLAAFVNKSDESTLGRLLVELTVLQTAHSPSESNKVLRDAAEFYKVDVPGIAAKVKQEFAAKDKAKAARKPAAKPSAKPTKKSATA